MERDPREGLIGANETCRRLGHVGRAQLSYLMKLGRLMPKYVDEKGWKFYDPRDVEDFAQTYPRASLAPRRHKPRLEGNVARRVFSCFKRCMSISQVVDECRVHPQVVRELYEEYITSLDHGRAEQANKRIEREQAKHARLQEMQSHRDETLKQKRRELDLREREARIRERELELEERRLSLLARPPAGVEGGSPSSPAS